MAGVLLRLRLRLLSNGLRGEPMQALSFILAMLGGLVVGLIAGALLATTSGEEPWGEAVTVVFAVLWFGWIVVPILTFRSDTTLDPRRFALFPRRARELLPGLLVAAHVGPGPFATLLALGGAVIGAALAAQDTLAALLAALAALAVLVTCVAWSRAMVALAADLLSSRRGRDITALAAMLLFIAIVVGPQLLTGTALLPGAETLGRVADIAAWTPGGVGGAAVAAAATGEFVRAVILLAVTLGTIPVAAALWVLAIRRAQATAPVAAATYRTARLYPRSLAWLPRGPLTAVAVRFLRTVLRDTRVRSQSLSTLFVLLPLYVVSASAIPGPQAPLYAVYLTIPFGLMAANQLGLEGPALWLHEVTGADPRRDLLGRNLALAFLALPLTAIGAVGLAAAFDGWASVPTAIVLGAASLATLLGVANVGAVLLPIPVPDDGNPFSSTQSGCIEGLLAMLVVVVQGIVVLPAMLPTLLIDDPALRLVAAGSGLVYGAAVLIGGTLLAAARADGRGPELLAAIDPGRS